MKIKIITTLYHPNLYASIKALENIADVELLVPEKYKYREIPKDIQHSGLGCIIKSNRAREVFSPLSLWKTLDKSIDYVVVKHINEPTNFFVYLVCRLKKIPIIIYVQKVRHLNSGIYYPLFRLLIKLIGRAKIFSVTKEGYEESKKYFKDVFYIPIAINYFRFKTRHYNTKSDTLTLIYVAKFQKRKNIDVLMEALKIIEDKHGIKTRLKIIAIRDRDDDKEYKRTRENVEKLRLKNRVSILTDVDNQNMNGQYNSADIFVFPATSEPLGFSLVEAMASGLPVVCSDEVGTKCYIKEGFNGYVIKAGSAEEIAKCLLQFIEGRKINWSKISRFGRNSRVLIEREHAPEVFLKRFKSMLKA